MSDEKSVQMSSKEFKHLNELLQMKAEGKIFMLNDSSNTKWCEPFIIEYSKSETKEEADE